MIASQRIVKMPPHTFDGIGLRCILGQEVQADPAFVVCQKRLHLAAVVKSGVVADDMNHSIAPQAATQVVEVGYAVEEERVLGTGEIEMVVYIPE